MAARRRRLHAPSSRPAPASAMPAAAAAAATVAADATRTGSCAGKRCAQEHAATASRASGPAGSMRPYTCPRALLTSTTRTARPAARAFAMSVAALPKRRMWAPTTA